MKHTTRFAFTVILLVTACRTGISQNQPAATPPPCSPDNPQHITAEKAFTYAGEAGKKNDVQTVRCWALISASEGNAEAQYEYSRVLLKGIGGPPDPAGALFWAKKSAEQNHMMGIVALTYYYQTGVGTPKDTVKADYWAKRALQFPEVRKQVADDQAKAKAQAQANAKQSQDLQAAALQMLLQPELEREAKLTPEQRKIEAKRLEDIEDTMDDPRCTSQQERRTSPVLCADIDKKWAAHEAERKAKQ